MTSYRQRENAWNVLFILALVGIAVAGWFAFLKAPQPKARETRLASIAVATRTATQESAKALEAVKARTWGGSLDALASTTLNRLTVLAEKNGLTLSSFRGDRAGELTDVTEAPFVVVVDGGFLDVVAFLNRLEQPDSKLAVEMLQIQASESNPGGVTATLGLVGFLLKEGR